MKFKKNFTFHSSSNVGLRVIITVEIFVIVVGIILANQNQESDTIEINSYHDHVHINTVLQTAKTPKLHDIITLQVNMNVSYAKPTQVTLQPIIKLDNRTVYKINPISKIIVGINQTLSHQFFIPLEYLGNNRISLVIVDSNNPNDGIEVDTTFHDIKVIR